MKQLPNNFYLYPESATTTATIKDCKELLLNTDGWVFACGECYDIVVKKLGAGVNKISLKIKKL